MRSYQKIIILREVLLDDRRIFILLMGIISYYMIKLFIDINKLNNKMPYMQREEEQRVYERMNKLLLHQ